MGPDGDPPKKLAKIEDNYDRIYVQRGVEFVPEYSDAIFKYWLQREKKHLRSYYLEEGITEMNRGHRFIAVKALFQIHRNMHLSDYDCAGEVLSLAVKLQDHYYMANPDADLKTMFLVSLASHSIADKAVGMFFRTNSIEFYELFSERRYDYHMIHSMEIDILHAINYESILVTGSEIMRRAHSYIILNEKAKVLARYILEASQLFYEFIVESESRMAAASQYVANKYYKKQWSQTMITCFGYKEKEIVSLAFKLNSRFVGWTAPKEAILRFGGDDRVYIKQHKFRPWSIKNNKKELTEH